MRLLITGILVCLIGFSSFSQDEKVNCIVFIDGKLPTGIFDEYFLFIDSIGNEKRIDFQYSIGDILLTDENAKKLWALNKEDEVQMNLSYKNYEGKAFSYSGMIKVAWLQYSYLVIRITNLNKRKGEYYFGYSTPGVIKKFIKKEYNMFEEY